MPVLHGVPTFRFPCLVGGTMNGYLVGFIAGIFLGVLLAPVFSPELIGLAAMILLVLTITLMYLFRRGIQVSQGGE